VEKFAVGFGRSREGGKGSRDPAGNAAISLQVKTSSGAWRQFKRKPEQNHWEWHVGYKASILRGDSIFYAFVDLKWGQGPPDVYVVPSTVVADVFAGTNYKMNMFWLMSADGDKYRDAWQPVIARVGAGKSVEVKRGDEPWLGFKVVYQLDPKLTDSEQDEINRSFISQAIEGNNLLYHGNGRADVQGFAYAEYPVSATEEQRQAVANWLRGNPSVVQFDLFPLEVELGSS